MFAVRRGFNFKSGLSAEITTSYVTTVEEDDELEDDVLLSLLSPRRSCSSFPSKTSFGYASTVNETRCPSCTLPISASSTSAMICIFVKSAAIVNKVGVSKPAATVCPSSTALLITTPLIGRVIVAYSMFRRTLTIEAWLSS